MFFSAIWRPQRLVDLRQALREMEAPSNRHSDPLGFMPAPRFPSRTGAFFLQYGAGEESGASATRV